MQCCPECISDEILRTQFIPQLAGGKTGKCPICNSENVPIVEALKLQDRFELLIDIYNENERGKTLIEWLKEDWLMFQHPVMDTNTANSLLAAILDDKNIIKKRFVPLDMDGSNKLSEWEAFRNELKHNNRFFPTVDLNFKQLEASLDHLRYEIKTDGSHNEKWYRARIQKDSMPYTKEQMGSPPKNLATHGRANPPGIPYLYLASDPITAISEIRPHTGETATIAKFTISSDLKLVDLREPRKKISPFREDTGPISLLRSDTNFLERLGEELTMPILPHAAAIDYTPSQYLCEFIKKCGYNGVMYNSSVGEGVNIALFDPSTAKVGDITSHEVTRVVVEIGGE